MRDEIIEMAIEANIFPPIGRLKQFTESLETFANLVAEKERERIAQWYETTNLKGKKFHADMIRANTPNGGGQEPPDSGRSPAP